MKNLSRFSILTISTVFFLGYCPRFTGVLGSTIGLLTYLVLSKYFISYTILVILLLLIGVWSSSQAEKLLDEKDSQKIIIDEVVGYLVATYGILEQPTLIIAISGFILFRLFDRKKFWIFKCVERIKGGLGIMMDDVLAGLVSNLIIRLAIFLPAQMTKFLGR